MYCNGLPLFKLEGAWIILFCCHISICCVCPQTLLEVYKPSKYNIQSGAASMERPLSSGLQTFQEKTDDFPLRKPMPKKTAPFQVFSLFLLTLPLHCTQAST